MPRLAGVALACAAFALHAASAAAAPTTYIRMPDGTELAARVFIPQDRPAAGVPAVLFYDGYDGGSGDAYVPAPQGAAGVRVSIRGTGCSGGVLDLFDRQHALDGREVVEWIARQPWSNGHVGMVGHSYSSISALMVAAEAPPHLDAIGVSATLYDLYRDLVYAGGIPNFGFPVGWTYSIRQAADKQAMASGLQAGDAKCVQNVATRPAPDPLEEPLVNGAVGSTDGEWWKAHSLYPRLSRIRAAVSLGHAWQDEQDGPRSAPIIFEKLPTGVPRQLVAANGHHNTSFEVAIGDHIAWLDRFMRDGAVKKARGEKRVKLRLEHGSAKPATIVSDSWPVRGTKWRRMYLRAGGALSEQRPGPTEGASQYLAATGRHSWITFAPPAGGELTSAGGPDEVTFRSAPVTRAETIAGPIAARLYAQTTAAGVDAAARALDTDFFVLVSDEAPDGSRTYVQRGMLRASFRKLDPARSRVEEGRLVRPDHPFVAPEPVVPGETYLYDIEVYPVAHVLRPGHRVLVQVMSPPYVDNLHTPEPSRVPALNTILHDAEHPSSVLFPFVPTPQLGPAPACGQLVQMKCVRPAG